MSSAVDTVDVAAAANPRPRHLGAVTGALILAGLSFALLQSLMSPALPEIQRALGASATGGAWILTGYLICAAVAAPVLGRLGDIFGKDRVLTWTLLVVTAGTLLSALATSLGPMLAGRALQGAGGALFPLAYGIIRDEVPRDRVPQTIALLATTIGVGGGLGMILAGPIIDVSSYHWLFGVPLLLILVALVGVKAYVPPSPVRARGRVSWPGMALLCSWQVCTLLAISQGPSWGWLGGRTLALLAVGLGLCVAWVVVEARSAEPLIDMAMMRIRGVWTTNAAAFAMGCGMVASFILFPQFAQVPADHGYGFGASVTQIGLYMLPCTVMMLLMGLVAGQLTVRVGGRLPALMGSVFSTAAYAMLALWHGEPWHLYVASTLLGIGIGLAFSSQINLVVEAVRPDQTGAATGMNSVVRTIGGALGATVAGAILAGGTAAGTDAPSEHAFTTAFAVTAGVCAIGIVASLAVPRRRAVGVPG